MAMTPSLRKKLLAAVGGGAIAIATVMLSGPDGLEGRKYVAYRDVVGVITVCDGHTGTDIVLGKTYSDAECDPFTRKDLQRIARQIDPYIKRPLSEETRAALYLFAYNVGAGNFKASSLLKCINLGDTAGACDQLCRWTYAGGKQWKGLVTRREIELEVCSWGQK